ncbi:stage II sporulation protein M [Staphylococcus schleiferi subsp. coagulans]|uniref:stage II sporulation protein M n=1 Tax=Staphylococcus coagulans TaxID=74706 RepID=UPI0015F95D43|nr:stage II sporulation protein M [Staphylococcus coagulans]MBA8778799.1 stage II sporulation protein M [Staphylococcus coagulans]
MLHIEDQNYFKRSIKIFIIAVSFFLLSFALSIMFSPSLETFKHISNQVPSSLDNAQGLDKLWNYILNNAIQVPFQMLILSLIPIPFLYFLNMISTTVITGIVFGFAIHFDFNKGIIMIVSSIPHSIIEILAMCFVISGLYKTNQTIIRKISNLFRKSKKQNFSFKLALSNLLKIYLLIALPLYILAAILETYFTDFIYNLFT